MIKEEEKLMFRNMSMEQLDYRLGKACWYGDLDMIKYLLTSSDLKEHANIHMKDDFIFINLCFNNIKMMEFLIVDCKIEKTEHIQRCLMERNDYDVMKISDGALFINIS